MVEFEHLSVMPAEVLQYLAPRAGGVYLDGTLGGAGHSRLILEAAAECRLIGLDRDPAALAKARQVLAPFDGRVSLHHATFADAHQVLTELGVSGLDGMLLDLGVSSHQLDTAERGFSFQQEAPLDMRMDTTSGMTAAEVVAEASVEELTRIFREYGEERFAGRIARKIEAVRTESPIQTTIELADLVRNVVPRGRGPQRIHPATRVFQALRIHVNSELDQVREGVARAIDLLNPGGRLVVISFHSLEDRLVKHMFRDEAKDCICPPKLPVCMCDHTPRVKLLTRKGVKAGEAEIDVNVRSRSAVLRAVEKV